MVRWNYCALFIATTNSTSTVSFNLKLRGWGLFKGFTEPVNSHTNLVAYNLRITRRHIGWVFNILYSILYKECQSLIYHNTNVTITIFMHITCTITHQWLFIWQNSSPFMAIKALIQIPYQRLYNPTIDRVHHRNIGKHYINIKISSHNYTQNLLLYKLAEQLSSGLVKF